MNTHDFVRVSDGKSSEFEFLLSEMYVVKPVGSATQERINVNFKFTIGNPTLMNTSILTISLCFVVCVIKKLRNWLRDSLERKRGIS